MADFGTDFDGTENNSSEIAQYQLFIAPKGSEVCSK